MDYKKIVIQWKEFEIPIILPRLISINTDTDFITTVTGPRRAGKTYLCFQEINNLIKKGVSKENIFYINFEDDKLIGATTNDLDKIFETFKEVYNPNKNQSIYLFLDEIQNVNNWDIWVRRIYDIDKKVKIVLTGSSSKLLSREISTRLRGRILNIEVFPLSFKEYLNWKGINYNINTISQSKDKIDVKKEFNKYLVDGGYPSILNNKEELKETILQSYFQSMIFKDVVERYKIKEIKKLQILIKLLFEAVTKDVSYSKLARRLDSFGFSISKNTVINYISYLEEAYLFFQNMRYNYSITKQMDSTKKIYCLDNGLLNSVSFKFSDDIGKLMENMAYIELKRRGKEVYYHRKNNECDFLIKAKNKIVEAIQITKEINEDNKKREINGLLEALSQFKLKKGIILTEDIEREEEIGGKLIKFIPLWKWLLLE